MDHEVDQPATHADRRAKSRLRKIAETLRDLPDAVLGLVHTASRFLRALLGG
jgi:hypothetical protein